MKALKGSRCRAFCKDFQVGSGMTKTSLKKYDYGSSVRAKVNMPLDYDRGYTKATNCTKGTILPIGKCRSSRFSITQNPTD